MSVAIPIPLLQHLPDVNVTPAVGVDEYALVWDNDTARFVLRAPFAGLLATGATVGATAQAQAFTNGIVGPSWKPSADSTTALQLQNAAGANVLNVDTTYGLVGIGTASPATPLHIYRNPGLSPSLSSDLGLMTIDSNVGPQIQFGIYNTDSYAGWIQVKHQNNGGSSWPLVLNPLGGLVGIGTASPATALHVVGAATITGGIRPAADSITALQLQNVAGTSILSVDTTNSRVAIGTTGQAQRLAVKGSSFLYDGVASFGMHGFYDGVNQDFSPYVQIGEDNTWTGYFSNNANFDGANYNFLYPGSPTTASRIALVTGGHVGIDVAAGSTNPLTWVRRFVVLNNGNVGINDIAPAEALDVTGNINATGVYKVDDVQVLSNRVIDARCADVANSGDATTDGLIDALRDAMVAHGLIAAA